MKIDIISKTFLSVYRFLNSLAKSIDRVVKLKGINSSSFNDYYKNNTFEQSQEIINLTNRKITLINIKVIVDQTLLGIDEQKARLLILKYIDNFSCKQICELVNLNTRTYFRRVNKALKDFEKVLGNFFENNTKIYDDLMQDKWVSLLLNTYSDNKIFEENFEGGLIYKTLVKLKKSFAI